MFRIIVLILCIVAAPALAQPPEKLLLTNANVLAPDASKFLHAHDFLIDGERIAKIAPSGTIAADTAKKIDCTGLYLLPGLIDLHTHFLLHPYNETIWDDQVLREPLELRTIRGTLAARQTLEAGFTTVRDLGTEGAAFADVALRDAINLGLIPGPRMFVVTRAIVATGCYGPAGFDHRWEVPQGAQEATGPDEVRKAVREQIAAGADWIKVYADYRRGLSAHATSTFSQEELDALVDEARSAGRPAVAHATLDESIRRAVKAGVSTIEHGFDASLETFQFMKEHDVVFCPTLSAGEAMVRYEKERASRELQFARPEQSRAREEAGRREGEAPAEPQISTATVKERGRSSAIDNRKSTIENPNDSRIVRLREVFQRALQSGVTIACGSDAGVFAHGDNARELALMVEFGMTPQQAILSATATAAKVLRHESDLGQLAPGFYADLIAVRANPLDSISALRYPTLVLKSGTIILDRQSVPRP